LSSGWWCKNGANLDGKGEIRTIGKKIIAAISSSFSVSTIARPPSLGMIKPTTNTPKNIYLC
jgi:hypothetical protein